MKLNYTKLFHKLKATTILNLVSGTSGSSAVRAAQPALMLPQCCYTTTCRPPSITGHCDGSRNKSPPPSVSPTT